MKTGQLGRWISPPPDENSRSWLAGAYLILEILHRPPQTVVPIDFRLPTQELAGPGNVRLPELGIVLRQRLENDAALASRQLQNLPGEFEDRHFVRVAKVDRLMKLREEQPEDALDQITDIAE